MTRALPFTKARLRRAIQAARQEGLRVTGIGPDGTLIVTDGTATDGVDNSFEAVVRLTPDGQASAASKWEDVEA